MPAALLFALQAVGPPLPAPEKLRATRACRTDPREDGEVVVCGRPDQEAFRLRPLPDRADAASLRAEVGIAGDLKAAAEVERANVGGIPSNRIMLRLKLPL